MLNNNNTKVENFVLLILSFVFQSFVSFVKDFVLRTTIFVLLPHFIGPLHLLRSQFNN